MTQQCRRPVAFSPVGDNNYSRDDVVTWPPTSDTIAHVQTALKDTRQATVALLTTLIQLNTHVTLTTQVII